MILAVASVEGNSNEEVLKVTVTRGEGRKKVTSYKEIHFQHFIITSEVRKG
jgi:hypothetical protein